MSGAGNESVWGGGGGLVGFVVVIAWRRNIAGVGQVFGMLGRKESGSNVSYCLGLR